MFLAQRIVQTHVGQILLEGLLRDMVEPQQGRITKSDCVGADLVGALVVDEVEQLILLDWPANGAAILFPREEGVCDALAIGGCGIGAERAESRAVCLNLSGASEGGKGGHVVVGEEEEGTAVRLVGGCGG